MQRKQFFFLVSYIQIVFRNPPSKLFECRLLIHFIPFVITDSVCLICYISTGNLIAYSLPSLRQLMAVDFLPLADLRYILCLRKHKTLTVPLMFVFRQRPTQKKKLTHKFCLSFLLEDQFCSFLLHNNSCLSLYLNHITFFSYLSLFLRDMKICSDFLFSFSH